MALLAVYLAAGCASIPSGWQNIQPDLPRATELTQVPFFAQVEHHCGPASLAMALNAAGISAAPGDLAPLVFLESREGTLPLDLLGGARRMGALAVKLPERAEALLSEVAAGRPVIVLQNLSLPIYPLWHYAVVIGYDLERAEITLRSGRNARQVLPLRTFEHTWARSGHWAMLALAPGELPRHDDSRSYIEAALALERLRRWEAAHRAYEAGIARWPSELTVLIGAGNTAFAQGDLVAAENAFRRAAQAHPKSAAVLNNLAHVLAQRGALEEAQSIALRAASLQGAGQSEALVTLEEIRRRVSSENSD